MATLTESNTQTFAVGGVPTVIVENTSGDVRVVPGDDGSVIVSYTKRVTARDEETAREILANIEVEMIQNGDDVRVTTRFHKHRSIGSFWNFNGSQQIDIAVTVPRAANLRLALNSGDAAVNGIEGAFAVHCNSGDLAARDMRITGQGDLHMNSGDVRLENVTVAAPTRFELNSGNVRLENVTVAAPTRFEMNSGNVNLQAVTFAAAVEMRANSGDIRGDVTLADGADLRLAINSGAVALTLPETTAAHVEATAMAGDLRATGFPLTATRRYAAAQMVGDLAPNPTSTITCKLNSGSFSLSAR
jgi:DUF4097 and DUF4098 domain-containing protein YvlB